MQAIVTLRLPKQPDHDPKNKRTGECPISNYICTDVTGEHHSYLEEAPTLEGITSAAKVMADRHSGRVTRIEVL